MNDYLEPSAAPDFLLAGSPSFHVAPQKSADIEAAQMSDYFSQLDAYGRRCALAMVKTMARLRGGAA